MPFRNPIVAGLTLIRAAIRSPNFVAGVSGWSINRDGSVEINNLTARGDLSVGTSPTNTEITRTIPAQLLAAYPNMTSVTIWHSTSTRYFYQGPDGSGRFVRGEVNTAGAGTVIEIDQYSDVTGVWRIGSDGHSPIAVYLGDGINGSLLTIPTLSRVQFDTGSDLQYNFVSQPRGFALYERYSGAPFSSTTAATTEQVMATSASMTFKNGRAYRVTWAGKLDSASLMTVQPRVRLGSLVGTNLVSGGSVDTRASSADVDFIRQNVIRNDSGSDINSSLLLTFANGAANVSNMTGTGSAANTLEVVDVGDSTDYSNATAM